MTDQVLAPTVFVDLFKLIQDGNVEIHVGQSLAIVSIPPVERPGCPSLFSMTVPASSAALLSQPAFTQSTSMGGQPENTLLEGLLKAEKAGVVEVTLTLQNTDVLDDPKVTHVVSVTIVKALHPAPGRDA